MPHGEYMLDTNGNPVEAPDALTWGKWMQTANRHVAVDEIGPSKVSTVFLGLDHSCVAGDPVLWETMVFGGPLDGEQDRYTSRDDAVKGHATFVERVKAASTEETKIVGGGTTRG